MTLDRFRQRVLRVALLLSVGAVLVGAAPVRGQPAPAAAFPPGQQLISVPVVAGGPPPAADPPSKGLSTSGRGAQAQSQAALTAVNATTHGCAGSSRSESRLGLLKNTAMYSHCDYP